MQSLPGVRSVGGISFLSAHHAGPHYRYRHGRPAASGSGAGAVRGFPLRLSRLFRDNGILLLQGRDFSWDDAPQSPFVVIVSQDHGAELLAPWRCIGKRIKLGGVNSGAPWVTVVGIVSDVHQLELIGLPRPAMYLPASQDAGTGDTLRDWVIRASGDPTTLASAVRSAVWAIDPTLPISRIQTMESVRSSYLGPQQFNLTWLRYWRSGADSGWRGIVRRGCLFRCATQA